MLSFSWAVAVGWPWHHGSCLRIGLAWMAWACQYVMVDIHPLWRPPMVVGMDAVSAGGMLGVAGHGCSA